MDLFSGQPDILDEDRVLPAESEEISARAGRKLTSVSGEFSRIRCGHRQRLVEKQIGGLDESTDTLYE